MMEVAAQNGSGQAATLDELAERINDEHRASGLALGNALDHAMAAGDLLLEAKAEHKAKHKHGSWTAWLEDNFEGTPRTAQLYMRLARYRTSVEDLKTKSVSLLGIGAAINLIAEPKEQPAPLWGPDPFANLPEGLQPDPAVLRGWEEDQAALVERKQAQAAALARLRAAERLTELCDIIKVLDQLVPKYPPEEAGKGLVQIVGEGRALTVLGDAVAWLQRVLEVAKQEQGRMQGDE